MSAGEFPVFWIAGVVDRAYVDSSPFGLPASAVGVSIRERRGLQEHDERTLELGPRCSNYSVETLRGRTISLLHVLRSSRLD